MDNLRQIIETHISPDIELISIKYDARSGFVRVTIDSADGISVDKTAILAKEIKNNEEIISNFPQGIRIEVGTPGLDSNLEKIFQFKKNIGRKIELEYLNKDSTVKETCLLSYVDDDGISVEKDNYKNNINYNDIISAKVKISFD
tara:strand:+ start:44 stop:478 length:435 start_codon:yes stop_codon:yes gene_type:complete